MNTCSYFVLDHTQIDPYNQLRLACPVWNSIIKVEWATAFLIVPGLNCRTDACSCFCTWSLTKLGISAPPQNVQHGSQWFKSNWTLSLWLHVGWVPQFRMNFSCFVYFVVAKNWTFNFLSNISTQLSIIKSNDLLSFSLQLAQTPESNMNSCSFSCSCTWTNSLRRVLTWNPILQNECITVLLYDGLHGHFLMLLDVPPTAVSCAYYQLCWYDPTWISFTQLEWANSSISYSRV